MHHLTSITLQTFIPLITEPLNTETMKPLNFYTHKDPEGISFLPVLKQVPLNNATC